MSTLFEQLKAELPLKIEELDILPDSGNYGLVIVDEINGFCTPGCGSLAPRSPDEQINKMVKETAKLAKEFSMRGWPILAVFDSHSPEKPEDPYPLHCLTGTIESELVPELKWLEEDENAVLMPKDCIDGFIGGIRPDGSNVVVDWVKNNHVEKMLVVGLCTDICALDFICSTLSARNHGLLGPLKEVIMYTEGCSTFNVPSHVANKIGTTPHPQDITHHMGFYIAASRGAKLVDKVKFKNVVHANGVLKQENGINGHIKI